MSGPILLFSWDPCGAPGIADDDVGLDLARAKALVLELLLLPSCKLPFKVVEEGVVF